MVKTMVRYNNRHSLWIRTIAIGMVCLFLTNTIVWAYPEINATTTKTTLSRWLLTKTLADEGVTDPSEVMLEAVTGIQFIATGKPARVANSILIENGPKVLYFFNKKERTYNIDFKINNILIETKDNHIWHKKEIESGKWVLKSKSAKEYCKRNNMEYKLIFPKDIEKLKELLILNQLLFSI